MWASLELLGGPGSFEGLGRGPERPSEALGGPGAVMGANVQGLDLGLARVT